MRSRFSSPVARILIVDDEPHVRKFLRLSLQAENLNVLEAATAEEAITLVHDALPDLMILDLGLPDLDGRQVIRDVRMGSDMPILVLSGRTEDSEKIAVLEQGADDYITKPFAMKELMRRVRSALDQSTRDKPLTESVRTGTLCIGLHMPEVTRDKRTVALEEEEYNLLRLLALHGGRVVTVGHIARTLWGKDENKEKKQRLQDHIATLRHKLETQPAFPRYIITEPAIGYRLEILPPDTTRP